MTNTSGPVRRVELVHDFVCARSYIGFTRLVRAVRRYEDEGGAVRLVLRPFQIRPGTPAEPEPLFEVHRRDRGEEIARAIRADTTLGAADGLRFRFDRALFTSTWAAHRLRARAVAQGRGVAMTERLFRAYFTDGLHLSDPAVLARLAEEAGVVTDGDGGSDAGTDALRAELGRTRALGSETGPVFRFGDGTASTVLAEEQPEEALLAALRGSKMSSTER
ncbi:DsbA family protein [Streptomyces sp. NPDC048172]|uniref:DsbA family oxidoreductase n=1 Tax=Streptomyces sp. NPDC048172 TaxID=3365505 RepID=UPI00371F3256